MNNKHKIILVGFLIGVALLGRMIPHLWNMTPVGAFAVLLGTKFGTLWSLVFLFGTLSLSDILLGHYTWQIMVAVYLSFSFYTLSAVFLKNKNFNFKILGTVGASLLFFLVTNFTVWFFGTMYPHNMTGLILSYTMALPFFFNQILGDLFFVSASFLVWDLSKEGILKVRNFRVKSLVK